MLSAGNSSEVAKAAGEWYQVGAFWVSLAAVVVSLAVGATAGWIASRNIQKRKLLYGTESSSPLLTENRQRTGIKVLANEKEVDNPHIVRFVVESRSRQDITDANFRNKPSLKILAECDILSILEVEGFPKERVFPEPRLVDARTIKVGPGVIAKRQLISMELLTDGDPKLSCQGELIDVEITQIREPTLSRLEPAFLEVAGATPLGGLTVSIARAALNVGRLAK